MFSFGGSSVDGAHQVELLGYVPKSRGGTEIPLLGAEGTSGSLRKEVEQFVGGAEVAQDAEAGVGEAGSREEDISAQVRLDGST